MPGDWSNIMKFKTDSKIYYKNSTISHKIISTIKKITKTKITKNSEPVESTPIITQLSNPQTQADPPLAEKKKCLLWWCW